MKLRFIYILAFSIFAMYVLQSKRLGLASQLSLDRTGSPIANGLNCGSCHSGALNNVTLTVTVKNSGGVAVTSYIPGNNYTIEFNVASNFGFSRGFQAVILDGSNAQAGTLSSTQSNTQISTIGTRQYAEQSAAVLSANSFVFIANWTAPAIGTGNVTVYSDAIVGNGNNAVSGDDPAGPVSVVLTEQPSAAINYAQPSYCSGDSDPTPTITGTTGGTFSATPSGLSLNSSTGEIDLSTSTASVTYAISYTYATGTATDTVTVLPTDNASFSYGSSSYCINSADPTPTITGLLGGTFASSPSGLSINSSTGQIDVSASTIGFYSVGYITNGSCPTVGTFAISITNVDNANFSYSNSTYCQNGSDPTPTSITGGGAYSSTSGLSINSSTGVIDLSTSTAGNYTITYVTGGACSNSSTQSVTINAADNASFSYGSSSYCQNGSDPTPTIGGTTGSFSSTSGLSINSSTGVIDVSASTANTYVVTYTTNGACPNTSTQSITINGIDNASFTYGGSTFCQNGSDPTPTIGGTTGSFSSTSGLSINSSTGVIDVSASTANTYVVTYTTNGACPNTSTQSVTINGTDNASFSYGSSSYCQNGNDPTPTIGGTTGSFSSTSGLSINSSTGVIDVSASTANTYVVTYTTNGACPNTSTQSITINGIDNASFTYGGSTFCQNGSDPTPTIGGTTGSFSSTSGLSINSSTGVIDVSASAANTYVVTYTTNGACPNTSTQSVTINGTDNASFSYGSSSYCQNGSDPTPTIGGTTGSFSSTSGLSINSNTGLIDVSASNPGTYNVTYTTNGPCSNTSIVAVTINATDNASFTYGGNTFCQNGVDPTPTGGLAGGTWSSTSGLSINTSSGIIDLSNSTPGTYNVTYTTNGACPNSNSSSITVTATDNASFAYNASSACQNGSDLTATVGGLSGGAFTSTTGLSINANSGLIDVSASTAGTYIVTYTTNGACPNSSTQSITITATDNASFTYGGATFCQNATDPIPTISLPGGTFGSTPTGLSINSSTGIIDVSASTAGTYNITYATNGACPTSSSQNITITTTGNSTFNYANNSYCVNESDPTPTISGNPGGTFSSTTGLIINSSTGEIDVSASNLGMYTITYAVSGSCPSSSTVNINIVAADNASFSYGAATYCQNGTDPTPTISGLAGGTWTATSGLSINSNTGVIDLSASTSGLQTITYTTNGACPNTSSINITITTTDNASFTYGSNSFCQNGTDPIPTIGSSGGTFSSTTGLVINASTGAIDVSASTAGTYSVTYATNGACPNSNSASITITATDNASFAYNASSACQNGSDLIATVNGVSGGLFTSTTGLSINANSGLVDVSTSTPGTYNVTYTTNGACPNSSVIAVTITATDNASFTYGGATFCQNATDPVPTIGMSGGTFSSTPTGLSINPSTGIIDVSASTAGAYTLTYTTNGACPNSSTLAVTITATGNASFNYALANYCQNVGNPTPTVTGNPGGVFSSAAGLVINASTGEVDLVASTIGTYTIDYTVSGACPSSSSVTLSILAADIATFTYTDTTICLNIGANPILGVTGTTTGTYSSTPSGLVFANTTTGEIDLAASVAGNYVVTYTSNGSCPATPTVNVDLSICGGWQLFEIADNYKLYPNPNEGSFILEHSGRSGNATIAVRDVFGKLIYLQDIFLEKEDEYAIDIPNLAGGIYLVEIQKKDQIKVIKMVVRK